MGSLASFASILVRLKNLFLKCPSSCTYLLNNSHCTTVQVGLLVCSPVLITVKLLSPVPYMTLKALVITTRKRQRERLKLVVINSRDLISYLLVPKIVMLTCNLIFCTTFNATVCSPCAALYLQQHDASLIVLKSITLSYSSSPPCRRLHAPQSGVGDRMQLCGKGPRL